MESEIKKYKVAVLGGGVTGTAIFYTLSRFTDIESVVLIEKCSELGQINSRDDNNSQTLHFGDIEANYSLEKAMKTKEASQMVVNYIESLGESGKGIYKKANKLLLAVGNKEIEVFEKRFEEFKTLFPEFRKISKNEIAKFEPEIVRGRKKNEKIMAGISENGYVVDFGKLAQSFANQAQQNKTEYNLILSAEVFKITKEKNGYLINTKRGKILADVVVVAMCAHSLLFAKSLGFGKEYSILPVGGNFYTSRRKVLNSKVYTMQSDKLPFAGVHGDPNIYNEDETRFGPTANILPFLERNNLKTFFDFKKSSLSDMKSIAALLKVISQKQLFTYLAKSLIYEVPFFGPRAYAKLCRKIVPTLSFEDFKGRKSKAGIRPQLINNETKKLQMGEIEIEGENILFNITPSPGATACLKNAITSTEKIINFLNGENNFYKEKLQNELMNLK